MNFSFFKSCVLSNLVETQIFKCSFQLLQSTNNLPSNSKPPQIKMQSTKKAPLRKEDGTMAAADDVATIAQSAGPNMTQPVRHKSIKILLCEVLFGVAVIFLHFFVFPASSCVFVLMMLLFPNLLTAVCPPPFCFLSCNILSTTQYILLWFCLISH